MQCDGRSSRISRMAQSNTRFQDSGHINVPVVPYNLQSFISSHLVQGHGVRSRQKYPSRYLGRYPTFVKSTPLLARRVSTAQPPTTAMAPLFIIAARIHGRSGGSQEREIFKTSAACFLAFENPVRFYGFIPRASTLPRLVQARPNYVSSGYNRGDATVPI